MKKNRQLIACMVGLSCLGIVPAAAQVPDSSFNNNGIVTTAIGNGSDRSFEVAPDNNNKIVVAGQTFNGSDNDIAVTRYNTDGSLDNSFGSGGIVITPVGFTNDYCDGMVIQPDGKIVVTGFYNDDRTMLIRYNTDGSLDNSFGTNGIVDFDPGPGYDLSRDVQLQQDGKIVITGSTFNGNDQDILFARFNTDGTPDLSFNGTGFIAIPVGYSNDVTFQLAIQQDGKIVGGGYILTPDHSKNIVLVRCNTNGTPDSSFGEAGISLSAWADSAEADFDAAYAITLQPDGKILLGGYAHGLFLDVDYYIAVARYNTDGLLDSTFGKNGIFKTIFGPVDQELSENVNDLLVQPDGKIIAAAHSSVIGYNGDFLLFRLNANGTIDNTFGGNGFIKTAVSPDDDIAGSIAQQPDGKILLGGYAMNAAGDYDFAAARYTTEEAGCSAVSNTAALNVSQNTATLKFKPLPLGRAAYRVRYKKKTSTAFTVSRLSRNSSLSLSGLSANTQYEWQVETVCGQTQSSLTTLSTFKTKSGSAITGSSAENVSSTNKQVQVFPNPVSNNMFLSLNASNNSLCEVRVADLLGRTVLQNSYRVVTGNNQVAVDMTRLIPGAYILTVKHNMQVLKQTIIKQ